MTSPPAAVTVGFTGRSSPVPTPQRHALEDVLEWLRDNGARRLVHGDCIEADSVAHLQAWDLGYDLILRPGHDAEGRSPKRAWNPRAMTVHPSLPYSDRNFLIARDADILVAAPATFSEILRAGEWQTIRMARKLGKPIVIVWPDGRISEDIPVEFANA